MPDWSEAYGLPAAVAIGVLLVGWFWAGNELMRRRSQRLALWAKKVIDPLGGKQSILWLGGQAFRLEVEGARAPFRSCTLTGLVESWEVPIVWAWNRLHGRRDMVVFSASLREQPLWGLEVYRPGTILAGDARHLAREEGWPESHLDEFHAAAPNGVASSFVVDLVGVLGDQRGRLVRLAVRRQGSQLTLALTVPDPHAFDPADATRLAVTIAERLART